MRVLYRGVAQPGVAQPGASFRITADSTALLHRATLTDMPPPDNVTSSETSASVDSLTGALLRAGGVLVQGAMIALAVLVFPHDAHADGLRCGSKLVSSNARPHEVRAACGEPDAVERRIEFETVRRRVRVPCPHSPRAVCEIEDEHTIPHTVDTWTYDFGPRRFVHFVIFVDGRLVRVETGSYGTKDVEDES